MQIENIHISAIKAYEKNPRQNDNAVEYVANSIREFGFKSPIIVDRNNVIVCGHTRLRAAQEIGLKTVPCIKADDLTDEQIKAYRIADNKTAEFSKWDFSLLNEELANLSELDFDMSSFGFYIPDDDYLESMFDEQEVVKPKAEAKQPPKPIEQDEYQTEDSEQEYEEQTGEYGEEREEAQNGYSVTVIFDNEDELERFIEYCETQNLCYERCND